jgi:hypothetical protein
VKARRPARAPAIAWRPRSALSRAEAIEWLEAGPGTFDTLVERGVIPRRADGSFDRHELDALAELWCDESDENGVER